MLRHIRMLAATTTALLALVATLGASAASAAPKAAPAGGPWGWSTKARAWSSSSGVLPAALVKRGPTATITRDQYLAALVRVQELRAERGSATTPGLLALDLDAPALADAPAGSAAARAVAAGWFPARPGRRFDGAAPVTANDMALATAGALGLRPTVVTFALRLHAELPGVRASWTYASAHAIIRTLGLRYNVEDPYDELELGPTEAVNVAHGAYALNAAATRLDSWKLDEARRMAATFDLPALGPNQTKLLGTAVRQLGQPYVWAGETEGSQVEGHGGFDCSGFTIRVVNQSGVAAADLRPIGERTTYTQSAIPAARRIARAKLQPGDALFFGDRGPASKPAQNFHAGVYMGNGWFIHSSGGNGGVAINSLDGWWGTSFAWGRRALVRP